MKKAIWLIWLLVLILCGPVSAEFYKYIDRDGNVRYTDDLNNVPVDQRPNVKSYDEAVSPPSQKSTENTKESQSSASESKPQRDPAADSGSEDMARRIRARQDALQKEYQGLMEEKKRLDDESKKATNFATAQQVNQKISKLNEKIAQYEEKRKSLNAEIEAYNSRVKKKE